MIVRELLGAYDPMQIRLHKLLNEIHLPEKLERLRLEDVEDGDDVLVPEVEEQPDLAQRPQREHGVVERCDALDRHFAL